MFYTLIGVITLCYVFYTYVIKKHYEYWKVKNVKGPEPSVLSGNFGKVLKNQETLVQFITRNYEAFPEEKVVGLFQSFKPVLLIRDPELIKHVLIKDFSYFQDRGLQPLSGKLNDNLFSTESETWRTLRQKLTPIFTSGKIKNMSPLMENCIDMYVKYVNYLIDNNIEEEMRSIQSKLTLEIIGSCAFGLDLHTFSKEDNEFVIAARNVLNRGGLVRFLVALEMVFPGSKKMLSFIPDKMSEYETFFINLVKDIIGQRGGKPSTRKDFMDFMIELKNQGKVSRRETNKIAELEVDEGMIAAQAFIFYVAGFETSAGTTSFVLYELALNPEIQERVYEEVSEVYKKYDGNINYESLSEMTYLEMVFDETLRKYPVLGTLFRKCVADYELPGTNIKIKKGSMVFVPVSGLHFDTKYFPNPNKFDPERFSPENKKKMPSCVYLPFGDGPRNCIGMRFAKVQSMLGLAAFLKNFKVVPNEKTQQPLKFSSLPTLTSEKGIWLKILKR